ncbi:unnamed protein product [Closterium sp. NIES-53]
MASYRPTGTYVDAVPPPGANIVSGMWLYKVKRSPGAPPVFKACYVARGGRLLPDLRSHPEDGHTSGVAAYCTLAFFASSADPSMFVRRGSTPFFVLVYVDNLVFATPDRCAHASVKGELQGRHTCTDLGELQRYLGLQITRDRTARTITLMQWHVVEQILTRFRFPFSKVQPTPLIVDHGLTAPPSNKPFESSDPYPELVGCLILGGTLSYAVEGITPLGFAICSLLLLVSTNFRYSVHSLTPPTKEAGGAIKDGDQTTAEHRVMRKAHGPLPAEIGELQMADGAALAASGEAHAKSGELR